jgi:acyl-coenzyme A synthetase/AMP-(fatty) acid ligase
VAALLESACVCVPDEDGVDSLVMFYVARPGEAASVEQALRERAAGLPPHQRPRCFSEVPVLPRTPTGKLLRRKLVQAFLSGGAAA